MLELGCWEGDGLGLTEYKNDRCQTQEDIRVIHTYFDMGGFVPPPLIGRGLQGGQGPHGVGGD